MITALSSVLPRSVFGASPQLIEIILVSEVTLRNEGGTRVRRPKRADSRLLQFGANALSPKKGFQVL